MITLHHLVNGKRFRLNGETSLVNTECTWYENLRFHGTCKIGRKYMRVYSAHFGGNFKSGYFAIEPEDVTPNIGKYGSSSFHQTSQEYDALFHA